MVTCSSKYNFKNNDQLYLKKLATLNLSEPGFITNTSSRMNKLKPIQSIILVVLISIPFKYHVAASDDKCAVDAVSFFCPNCGGIEVTDCKADSRATYFRITIMRFVR